MPLAPSPMESFGIGQSIGQANSPVTGIGMAIQNIVDDARKKGLLAAQSQFQTAGANQNAIAKETRAFDAAEAAGPQPKGGFFTDKGTGKTGISNATYDPKTRQWVEKVSPASFNLMESMLGEAGGGEGGDALENTLNEILKNLYQTGE